MTERTPTQEEYSEATLNQKRIATPSASTQEKIAHGATIN